MGAEIDDLAVKVKAAVIVARRRMRTQIQLQYVT